MQDDAGRIVCKGDQITRKQSENFILIQPVSFVRPWLLLYRERCASFSADVQ
jgi:hypothetical protein